MLGKSKNADEQKKIVSVESEIVGKKASEAEAIEKDAKAELDAAEPEVRKAKAALNAISAKDLVELKAMPKLLPGVLKTMQVIFILSQGDKKGQEWTSIKNRMKNPALLLK